MGDGGKRREGGAFGSADTNYLTNCLLELPFHAEHLHGSPSTKTLKLILQ